ncbi:hypothetical protein HID58_063537, partial [Brassica napus]
GVGRCGLGRPTTVGIRPPPDAVEEGGAAAAIAEEEEEAETRSQEGHILWRSKKVVSIEMVLVDATGTRIHASIDEDLIQIYEGKVFEGDAFFISNFTLVNYATEYRTNPFPYKLTFYRTTNITPCDDFPSYLPNKYLKNFSEIHSGIFKNDVLIDVVGQIVHVGALTEIYAKGNKLTNSMLFFGMKRNASNLTCTLWGDYGKQVIDYVEENNNSIVVCVVRFACVTEYKGVHGISNVFNATQLIFDPPGPHFDDFRSKLPKDDIILSRDDGLSGSTIGKYVTTATVKSVETNPRWYYVVCAVCEKTVHPIEENPGDEEGPVMFDCLQCNRNVTEVLAKFKLVLLVTDDSTEEAKFLIFDNIAYPNFLNKTADELAEEVAEDDDSVLPRTLNDLIGKTLLFKMGVTSKNLKSRKSTFIVDIVTDDEVIIEQFLTQNLSKDATISYADDASQCSIMKNGNNKRLGVMDDGVVNKRRQQVICYNVIF